MYIWLSASVADVKMSLAGFAELKEPKINPQNFLHFCIHVA